MDKLSTYDSLVNHARLFYQESAINNQANANEHFSNFVETAEKANVVKPSNGTVVDLSGNVLKKGEEVVKQFNPSVIRMALQQGQCDILAGCRMALESGQVDESGFNQLQKNIVKTTQRTQRSGYGLGLMADVKKAFPKTFMKRTAITQCLRDGAFVMLENDAEGRTAATVKAFGEDLGLANVRDLKPEKIKILNVLRVGAFFDKILFGIFKGAKGIKKVAKMVIK